MAYRRLADDLILIDTHYQQTPDAIGVYLLVGDRPALIETGPASTIDAVLEGMREAGFNPVDLQAVAVTHIHLDHAGGAGTLVRRLPHLDVYLHPIGAPHLIDPTRLLASAVRLYGDDLPRLFGEVVPIPAERVHIVGDGDVLSLGSRRLVAVETPGHARHHHAFWDPSSRDLFTGDAAGVALPGSHYVRAPTPPPELDVGAWERSLARMRALGAHRLLVTHFGPHEWVDGLLQQLAERLHEMVNAVRQSLAAGLDEPAITARLRDEAIAEIERRDGPESRARHELIMPNRLNVLGLIRYIEKSGAPLGRTP